MAYKYLYVDDTREKLEQGMINAISADGDIEVEFKHPSDWETIIEWFKATIPEYDGVILDLRLNDQPYDDNKFANYKGSTVAQELRSLVKEGILSDFPIILFSGTNNLENYLDPTSKDLFDSIIDKTRIEQEGYITFQDFRKKLKWLVDGYRGINELEERTVQHYFNIEGVNAFDSRFVEHFSQLLDKPTHIMVQFLIKEVFYKPCFLISEDYLSARLGVRKDSKDWGALLEIMAPFKYNGVFSTFYNHWWMPLIVRFWQESVSADNMMRNTSAELRCELLSRSTGLHGLTPLEKTPRSKSSTFWVSCKATKVAIDTVDGYAISGQDNRFPWQEPEYISPDEALRPTAHYTVSITERPRLEKLKALVEKNEQRIRK